MDCTLGLKVKEGAFTHTGTHACMQSKHTYTQTYTCTHTNNFKVAEGEELERLNSGCQEGWPDVHLKYVLERGALETSSE